MQAKIDLLSVLYGISCAMLYWFNAFFLCCIYCDISMNIFGWYTLNWLYAYEYVWETVVQSCFMYVLFSVSLDYNKTSWLISLCSKWISAAECVTMHSGLTLENTSFNVLSINSFVKDKS